MRRLFLFAGYDKTGKIGSSLLWYLKSLANHGDVIFVADSDINQGELEKLESLTLHNEAAAHGEYDFGSYKRAFGWAKENVDLNKYEYIYMVNDSVYGPLYDISTYLHSMESLGAPAFSLVLNPHRRHPHLQSWFIGLTPEVFASKWFSDFILSVRKEDCKEDICVKYETGLTELVASRGLVYDALYKVPGKKIYNSVKSLYIKGLPFVKKAAFVRHNGSLGAQLSYIFQRLDPQCREAILSDAERIYGKEYTERLLTGNPFCIAFRYLAYLISKLYSRRIWQSFFQVFV